MKTTKSGRKKNKPPVHRGKGGEELFKASLDVSVVPLASRAFASYAGPSVWSDWSNIASYLGVVTYHITAEPVGATALFCRVRYYRDTGQVIEEFREETTITTGNVVANLEVSFKGIPTGSAVNGTVEP